MALIAGLRVLWGRIQWRQTESSTPAPIPSPSERDPTITRRAQPAGDLGPLPANGAAVENGGSVFVYSSDPAVVQPIRRLDVRPGFTVHGCDWRQRVWLDRIGEASYLAGGTVEPAT